MVHGSHKSWVPSMPLQFFSLIFMGMKQKRLNFDFLNWKLVDHWNVKFSNWWIVNCVLPNLQGYYVDDWCKKHGCGWIVNLYSCEPAVLALKWLYLKVLLFQKVLMHLSFPQNVPFIFLSLKIWILVNEICLGCPYIWQLRGF